jgi:hypothetical protein
VRQPPDEHRDRDREANDCKECNDHYS